MKAKQIITLIVGIPSVAFSPEHGRPATVAAVVALVAAAVTSVEAVSTEEVSVVVSAAVALVLAVFVAALWPPHTLEAEP